MENEKVISKKYSPIFWRLFGFGLTISSLSATLDSIEDLPVTVVLINNLLTYAIFVLIFFWCKYFNESWKKIGKKYGWALGLITIIPFGSILALIIARHYLKNTEYWQEQVKPNTQDNLDSKRIKTNALILILLMIAAFFVTTFLVGSYAPKEMADALGGPIIIVFGGAVIGLAYYFNNKIERLKNKTLEKVEPQNMAIPATKDTLRTQNK